MPNRVTGIARRFDPRLSVGPALDPTEGRTVTRGSDGATDVAAGSGGGAEDGGGSGRAGGSGVGWDMGAGGLADDLGGFVGVRDADDV